MAATGESSNSSLHSIDEMKLPSLTALTDSKSCPKCQHVMKNGVDIHSTLAYSRCRCHRDWKYENQSHQLKWQQSQSDDAATSRVPQMRYYTNKTTKRCLSAIIQPNTYRPMAMDHQKPQKIMKLKYFPLQQKKVSLLTISSDETVTNDITKDSNGGTMSSFNNTSVTEPTSSLASIPSTSTVRLPQSNAVNSTSSITKLPSIVSINVSPSNTVRKHSPLQAIKASVRPIIRKSTQVKAKKQRHFEFTHLLKYVPLSMKQKALEIFGKLDLDGDGHLSYFEVLNGLIGDTDNCSAKAILESYLKPIYHLLGDTTYFGKRDFVLCYSIAKLLREHRLPKIACSQSTDFYIKTMKPLMSLMYLSATEEGTIPIFVIEEIVKEFSQKADIKLVFRKFKVTNLIEEDGLLSLINTFILAPFLFEVV